MFVPAVAMVGALFKIERSATRWAVVMAVEELLVASVSSVRTEAVTVAVLVIVPVVAGLMWTTMVKILLALGATTLFPYTTLFRSLVQPALAETKLTWS